jgi:hypothetical protein
MIRTESIKQQRFAHRLFCGAGQPTRPIRDSLNAPPQSERETDQSAPILQEKTEKQTFGARRRQTWYPREPSL